MTRSRLVIGLPFLLSVLFLPLNSLLAKEESLSAIFKDLTDVESNSEFKIDPLTKKKSVWIVFQKGCSTCHQMMKESRCYKSKNIEILALGLYEKPSDLLKDARANGYKGTVLVSKNAVDVEQDMSVTPTTFIFNQDKLIKRLETYVDCKKIKAILKD